MKFSQTSVNAYRPPADSSDHTIWDDAMPGFGVRYRNGKPGGTYLIQTLLHGKQVKIFLGKVARVNLADAQIEARQHFAKLAKGVNPAVERASVAAKAGTTIGSLVPRFLDYLRAIPRAPTYVTENDRSLNKKFKTFHRFNPDDVNRAMVAAELVRIAKDDGKSASRNSRAHLSKFYSWAIGEGLAENNPVSGTNKHESNARERYHDEKEIVAIWKQLNDDNDYDVIQKLLILTGARRDQIGQLKRSEVKRADKLIDLAGKQGRSKNKKRFIIPLSRQALTLIEKVWDRREDSSDYIFGRADSKRGFSGWSKCKERLDEKLGDMEPWTLHDYRRTFDTLAQDRLKILEHVADACLNHKGIAKAGVKGTYNYAQYIDEKTDALLKWGNYIDGLIHPKPKLRVVS